MKGQKSKPKVRRLYRSGKDKMLFGVCGGIAEFLNVDPTIIRLFWALGTIASLGAGLIFYLIAAVIMPRNPNHKWN